MMSSIDETGNNDQLKENLIKEVEKIAKENNTSFNNVIVSMIETCLKMK